MSDAVHIRVQLNRTEEEIDLNQDNWELINRFAQLFRYTVSTSTFSGACEQAFEAAVKACNEKKWSLLSKEDVQDDLARLAVYFRGPLINYAISQNEPWAFEMIEKRIDIHSLDFEGNTALHTAAREGAAHLIPLLSTHIEPHQENLKHQTPLEVAIQFGKDQVVFELIKKGVNINRPIPVGEDRSISLTGIGFAVMRGEIPCIEKLIIEGKCSLEDRFAGIGNLLHVAIHFHQFEALEYLLEKHRDKITPLINQKNDSGLTPLTLAALVGEKKPIHLLHKAQAFFECEDHHKKRPIHYAAMGLHYEIIQLLAALKCKIDPIDEKNQRPIDLIAQEPGRHAASCRALLKDLKKNKELRNHFPAPTFHPPTNLVFRGGGPKGIAFLGALQHLQSQGHLAAVKRVAGTSAGAITSSLIATGYPMHQLEQLLMTTNLMTFLDHPFSLKDKIKDLKEKNRSAFQVINTLRGVIHTCHSITNPLGFIANQLKKLYQCTGLCEGEAFRIWMEEQIASATGIQYLTFGELSELAEKDSKYKHLHVYGTKVGNNPQIVQLSSQNPDCRNMIISDAVRISMSIPGVFKPHIMHILQKNGEKRSRIPYPEFGSFLDGGMLYNFPIETFDQKQYLTQKDLGPEGRCPKYNKETIGFSLFSSLTPEPIQKNVDNIGDLLKGIFQVYLSAEEAIRSLNPYNQSRVIEIDVKDVGTLSFNMSDEKKKELVTSGQRALEAFISNQTSLPPPLPAQPSSPTDLIESRKAALEKNRTYHPDKYPPYLDQLLEKGYIHLYDHLLDMRKLPTRNERENKIKTLTFSETSHIILETQKAVMNQVTSTIPPTEKNILFLLGQTGAGKSTTLCFLRGDEMELDINGKYRSKNPQDDLIGHGSKSCTFLPTVATLSDLAILDFPGFSDTNGSLIALGMECALKSLIGKYQPKILVLEAITNTEGRYASAAKLGTELKRLIGATENCVLGITKYSKDLNFIQLKSIEDAQKKQLTAPSPEEVTFETQIQALIQLNMPALQPQIEDLQKQLDAVKEKKPEGSFIELPDTQEKKDHRSELAAKEKELLAQMGLQKHLPLTGLENFQEKIHCLNYLSSLTHGTSWTIQHLLNADQEKLLKDIFENDLMPKIDALENFDVGDINTFGKAVMESSLIKVILSPSHPEIGDFLHLPGIDPKLRDYFDQKVVETCIRKIVDTVIKTIDVSAIKKVIKECGEKASPGKKETLESKQQDVRDYILGLKGIKTNTQQESDKEWKTLQEQLGVVAQNVEDKYTLGILRKIALAIPFGIPLWMHNNKKQQEKENTIKKTVDETFDAYCCSLDDVYSALTKLKEIEKVIQKQEQINQAAASFIPNLNSLGSLDTSLRKKAQAIGNLYGSKDWEHRLNWLSQQLEHIEKDLIPLLYLGCDPSFEIIKLKGNTMLSRNLLRSSGISEKNALLFEDKASGQTTLLKKYGDQEEKLDSVSKTFRDQHKGFFESGNSIETLNTQTHLEALAETANNLGVEINTPLFQTLLSAAAQSKIGKKEQCFLGEGLSERSIGLVQLRFGKEKWEEYFGDIGVEPPLPKDIEQILDSPCIFWPDKKVRDTHLLVLIPKTVNGEAFHLNRLGELIQSPNSGYKTQYRYYYENTRKELGKKQTESHWVLMTRDVIPDSRARTYEEQQNLVRKYAQPQNLPYELPEALEAATAILMHYIETQEALYTDNTLGPEWTYTRCQEQIENQWPVAIGGFSSGGLAVFDHISSSYHGVGCLRKF